MKLNLFIAFLIYSLFAQAQHTKLFDFSGTASGKYPKGDLVSVGSNLYGMTSAGGSSDMGTIFKIKSDGTSYSKLLDFSGTTTGANPGGSLIYDGTFLYGMTASGGVNNLGTIFKIKPDGTGFTKLLDFNGTANGSRPQGTLLLSGGNFYGLTANGGIYDSGVMFKIASNGSGFVKLYDFGLAADGTQPNGTLISVGSFLYGTARSGGAHLKGTIFKIKPDGTGQAKLYDFDFTNDGAEPMSALFSDGTYLYGTTSVGGPGSAGTIFKIKPDGTGFSKLSNLSGGAGATVPFGSLISDGTYLYGLASQGGSVPGGCGGGCGVAFRIKPNGTGYLSIYEFGTSGNGKTPLGSLIFINNQLYGMTFLGGNTNDGTIFRLNLTAVGIAENTEVSGLTISPNPFSKETLISSGEYMEHASLSIYNIKGEEVKRVTNISGTTLTLSREELASGIYFLHLTQDNKNFPVQKLVLTEN